MDPKLTHNDAPLNPYRVLWDCSQPSTSTHHHHPLSRQPPRPLSPFWKAVEPLSISLGKTTHSATGWGWRLGAKLAKTRQASA